MNSAYRWAMKRLALLVAAVGACLLSGSAAAQEWPTRPVRIVNTFAPGGAADILARIVADQLSGAFKQQFFVETRAGAGGVIGVQTVANSEPDGYNFRHHHAVAHHHRPVHQSEDRLRPAQGPDSYRLYRGHAHPVHRQRGERREDARRVRRQVEGERETIDLWLLGPVERGADGGAVVRDESRPQVRDHSL